MPREPKEEEERGYDDGFRPNFISMAKGDKKRNSRGKIVVEGDWPKDTEDIDPTAGRSVMVPGWKVPNRRRIEEERGSKKKDDESNRSERSERRRSRRHSNREREDQPELFDVPDESPRRRRHHGRRRRRDDRADGQNEAEQNQEGAGSDHPTIGGGGA